MVILQCLWNITLNDYEQNQINKKPCSIYSHINLKECVTNVQVAICTLELIKQSNICILWIITRNMQLLYVRSNKKFSSGKYANPSTISTCSIDTFVMIILPLSYYCLCCVLLPYCYLCANLLILFTQLKCYFYSV